MADLIETDLCVIGAGSGGLAVAAGAAQMGAKGEMGGDCLNYGCVPSKSLIAAGKAAQTVRTAGRFGVNGHEPQIDFLKVHDHVRGVIAAIAPHDSQARFEALGVEVIRAPARFVDSREVEANGARGKGTALRHRHRLLARRTRRAGPRGCAPRHQRDDLRSDRAARSPGRTGGRPDRLRDGPGALTAWRTRHRPNPLLDSAQGRSRGDRGGAPPAHERGRGPARAGQGHGRQS